MKSFVVLIISSGPDPFSDASKVNDDKTCKTQCCNTFIVVSKTLKCHMQVFENLERENC